MLKIINNHIVQCSDIMKDQTKLIEMIRNKVDILYCDPPWGDGMIKFFNTLRKKQTNTYSENLPHNKMFLQRLAVLTLESKAKFICIENGNKWSLETEEIFKSNGFFHVATINGYYDKPKKSMKVHLFLNLEQLEDKSNEFIKSIKEKFIKNCTDKSGFELVESVFFACMGTNLKEKTVFDLCCGFGMTAKIAKKHGMNFIGNEVNQKRLDKTIKVLNG